MTFLELCKQLAEKASVSGSIASVVGQSGEQGRVVNWVREAYESIQAKHDNWRFLRREVEFPAGAGVAVYTPAAAGVADFGEWLLEDWRAYRPAAGIGNEMPICTMGYDAFRATYGYGNQRTQVGWPQVATSQPDDSLKFWPIPDDDYTIVAQYYRAPHVFANNDDVPLFAGRFHMAIVYRALMLYAEYESDGNLFASAQLEAGRLIGKMEEVYLPDFTVGEPLA
jgi:hypothetical protein